MPFVVPFATAAIFLVVTIALIVSVTIVETVAELWALERSETFRGRYHVLGSNLANSANKDPASLKLPALLERCKNNGTKEIIIATNATLDGQTTAYFITEFFTISIFYWLIT